MNDYEAAAEAYIDNVYKSVNADLKTISGSFAKLSGRYPAVPESDDTDISDKLE